MHRTGITRGAAASHTAWAKRALTHQKVVAALAAGDLSESYARVICQWTDRLPEKYRDQSDELLVKAAAGGLGLADGQEVLFGPSACAGGSPGVSAVAGLCRLVL